MSELLNCPFCGAAPTDQENSYARSLAVALHAKHFPEVTQWKPLDDTLGLLTQIDNMTCSLIRLGAAPTVVEPVAWVDQETFDCLTKNQHGAIAYRRWLAVGAADGFTGRTIPLYLAATPSRAALTDADLDKIIAAQWGTHPSVIFKAHRAFARAVIAADRGEKQ